MKYLATFHSHYQALVYKRKLEKSGVDANLKSVPRTLSSSCGTCCIYEAKQPIIDGIEAVYEEIDGNWRSINE